MRNRFAVRSFLKQAIPYFFFLFCVLLISMRNFSEGSQVENFWFTEGLRTEITGQGVFGSIRSQEDFYFFLDKKLTFGLFSSQEISGNFSEIYVANYDKLLGAVRLKQFRAKNDTCQKTGFLQKKLKFSKKLIFFQMDFRSVLTPISLKIGKVSGRMSYGVFPNCPKMMNFEEISDKNSRKADSSPICRQISTIQSH